MLCWLASALMELVFGDVQERQGDRQTTRSCRRTTQECLGRGAGPCFCLVCVPVRETGKITCFPQLCSSVVARLWPLPNPPSLKYMFRGSLAVFLVPSIHEHAQRPGCSVPTSEYCTSKHCEQHTTTTTSSLSLQQHHVPHHAQQPVHNPAAVVTDAAVLELVGDPLLDPGHALECVLSQVVVNIHVV